MFRLWQATATNVPQAPLEVYTLGYIRGLIEAVAKHNSSKGKQWKYNRFDISKLKGIWAASGLDERPSFSSRLLFFPDESSRRLVFDQGRTQTFRADRVYAGRRPLMSGFVYLLSRRYNARFAAPGEYPEGKVHCSRLIYSGCTCRSGYFPTHGTWIHWFAVRTAMTDQTNPLSLGSQPAWLYGLESWSLMVIGEQLRNERLVRNENTNRKVVGAMVMACWNLWKDHTFWIKDVLFRYQNLKKHQKTGYAKGEKSLLK